MKRDKPLLPSIILLVCAMVFGFIALAWIADASLLVMVLVGLVVVATSVMVLRFAVIFDRQMRQKRGKDEKKERTEC